MNLYATCCEPAASSLAITQYPPIAPNRNQVVKLLPHPGHLVGRAQIMPSGTPNQIHKAKQPQQILPKPIPPNSSPQKQSVPRLNTAMPQQTPLLINQSQAQSPTLLLNQVLTSGAPVIVQPAGPGGTVHLMLRTPTPALQSGPGPPQNKMIIANTTQTQPQATVLIQNRQQVVRFMTAQGPMQLQQIQTPSGPQLIAIPQNQSLSFPPNSVLVQSPTANTLQLQQNSGNALQLRQSSSAILQQSSFSQGTLQNQISLQNHVLQANPTPPPTAGLKRDEKSNVTDHANGLPGTKEQKKIVIDNKNTNKKNVNTISSNVSNNFNNGNSSNNNSSNTSNLNNNTLNSLGSGNSAKKNNKTGKKTEDDVLNKSLGKNITKVDNLITPVSVPTSTAQKNLTSSLRQVRSGAFGNRNKQNQSVETKEKTEDVNTKSLSNLTKIIDSVASNTEHLESSPKIDNLTATINSVAENVKSPTPDDIMSNLSLNDVFMSNKSLNLNKRPNLTIVQKQKPEVEEPNLAINRMILSPNSGPAVDFENIPENYDSLELSGLTTTAGVQTSESQTFILDQNGSSHGIFSVQEETKKVKKKACNKKKGKKEENRVDLWDLMKSAGIGDDEFDEASDINTFSQDTATITEPIEISASDSDFLAQIQAATQVPGGIRVVVGEDGRPVIINGSNVLIPDSISTATSNSTNESTDAEAVLQNMILPESVFNFTPQAFATAQTQLNQLIQDHGGIAPSSSDQQLLSQVFGATPNSIENSGSNIVTATPATISPATATVTATTTSTSTPIVQSSISSSMSGVQSHTLPLCGDTMLVNVGPSSSEIAQPPTAQKQEAKSEYVGGPPPGLPPLGPDSLVITNNNGVPTLVASPALMQYLQTHQGIIQFQHDPVTKTLQPSLIIPHPQHKVESTLTSSQDNRPDKLTPIVSTNIRTLNNQTKELIKSRNEPKTSVEAATDEIPNLSNILNIVFSNQSVPNAVKLNVVKCIKDNPALLQIANQTSNLIAYKEKYRNMSDRERIEVDKKIQHNRTILNQCFLVENNRGVSPNSDNLSSVIVKEGGNKESVAYQLGSFGVVDKPTGANKVTSETQTLEDLQNLDMTLIKGFHPPSNTNSPTPTSDFQAKFLESIGMANKNPSKASISVGTVTNPTSPVFSATAQSARELKKSRKKKDKIQNQAIQADVKTDLPSLTFNVAELTPEQNDRLNQALQSRGASFNHIDNLDSIKQIIHEEVRKITSNTIQDANIRFTNAPNLPTDDQEVNDQNIPTGNVVLSNANLNQILEQGSAGHGNVISLQGNDLVAINSGNQQIFTSQNQLLSGNHFVSSNSPILAIGGSHNQLVSLGSPINSSNQIVTLGSSPNVMSVTGNNVAGPGAVIVGNNGNVMAIVHQSSGQGSGIVQRIQTIQLTTPKQQHFKAIQSQIQVLSSKTNRTPNEQTTLQKLILEQQKILSTGKLVPTVPGQQVQGMQIVSQSITNPNRIYQAPQQQTQLSQAQSQQSQSQQNSQSFQQQQSQSFVTTSPNTNSQSSKFTTQTVVSCGTNTSDFNSSFQHNIPKMSVPPTVVISDVPTSTYGPLYVSPNNSNKNVTKCEKGTSPIQIQMGTQTVASLEYRSGKMSTGTMTSPNTGKPQAVVAPAIVIQQTESQSPTYQIKPKNQTTLSEPLRTQVPALNRTAFIEQQMRTDQAGATMPDTRTPFLSKSDAVKRLIRYHVMDEKALSPQDLATADDIFEATAQHLLDKFRAMKEKYKYLLMLESMREVSTAERIMVDRNFIIEERMELEELREKEKRLQEEFEKATITRPGSIESSAIKTEFMLDEVKTEINDFCVSKAIKTENVVEDDATMISKSINSDFNGDLIKDNTFKLTEANRNVDLTKIKSETKECKNTRTPSARSRSESPRDEDLLNISSKCKIKSCRTFSDGSSKSSLDSSKDEDSGTDINAQVQSAIDSILNLQKCETMSDSLDDGSSTRRSKKKRKHCEKSSENLKRIKIKGLESKKEAKNMSEESEDDEDGASSDADPILDEAIRSIVTS